LDICDWPQGRRLTATVSPWWALELAAGMVDRFHRMFLRTLRTLCNLRKVPLAVVVQNHGGQVNVGNQQLNVAASGVERSAEPQADVPAVVAGPAQ
jgi:hypothetical protein